MEKRNHITKGSPCDAGGQPAVRIVDKRALGRGKVADDPPTLKSFTEPLAPQKPAQRSRSAKCR